MSFKNYIRSRFESHCLVLKTVGVVICINSSNTNACMLKRCVLSRIKKRTLTALDNVLFEIRKIIII